MARNEEAGVLEVLFKSNVWFAWSWGRHYHPRCVVAVYYNLPLENFLMVKLIREFMFSQYNKFAVLANIFHM